MNLGAHTPLLKSSQSHWPAQTSASYSFDIAECAATPVGAGSENPAPQLRSELFMAGLAALLQRYSGQDRVELAVPISDASPLLDSMTWEPATVEVMPVTLDLSDNPAFRDLLERVQSFLSELIEAPRPVNCFLVGASILDACRVRLQVNRTQTMVRTSSLLMKVVTSADGFAHGVFEYDDQQFGREVVSSLAGQLVRIVRAGIANPHEQVLDLQILSSEEETRILVEWNQTAQECPDLCIHELFERQVERTPDLSALLIAEESISYRDLNARANRLAHFLRKRGAGPEVAVGLLLERSITGVTGILGILKSGGAYVPLDPKSHTQRLQTLIEGANITIIVTLAEHKSLVGAAGADVICLDEDAVQIEAEDPNDPKSGSLPDNSAYIMFTSGSTGEPKGIVGTHRCTANGISAALFDRGCADEVACLNMSLSVSFSLLALFLPLVSGVPLVLFTELESKDLGSMIQVIAARRISNLALVPTVLRELLRLDASVAPQLSSIRTVMAGGSALSSDTVERFHHLMPQAQLLNGYGASELSSIATKGRAVPQTSGTVSIGKPIANTKIYILDPNMNPVPVGVVGEIFVGSPHMCRGYLKRTDLTAERFLPNPFTAEPGQRFYRTGDAGLFRPDGTIDFVGRVDQQVKVRGFRVELGEIEAVLKMHEQVRDAVAVPQTVEQETRILAYVVQRSDVYLTAAQLLHFVSQRLPDFMVPSAVMFLDELPLSPGGKVDRHALPPVQSDRPELDHPYEPPRNSMEEQLASIWASLLGVNRVGIHDHFMEIGGDSLFAMYLCTHIQEHFGIEISWMVLYDRPTVADLAVFMSQSSAVAGSGAN